MSEVSINCYMKRYIQPFERGLAMREMRALARTDVQCAESGPDYEYRLCEPGASIDRLVERVAYWESIGTSEQVWTRQLRREATTSLVRGGSSPSELTRQLPFRKDSLPVPSRRCLRYGPHDIHEYRGKFFPQLVTALLNICDLPSESVVLDPMCGSGTTLVEASLAGYHAVGLDVNPLSVLIARTKCSILHTSPNKIIEEFERIRNKLLKPKNHCQISFMPYFHSLPAGDQRYLEAWFAANVLTDLDTIANLLDDMQPSPCKDLFWVCLSDILRAVSWQKTDDLRVRRESKCNSDIDVIGEYLSQLERTVRHVAAFLLEDNGTKYGSSEVLSADARNLAAELRTLKKHVDVVVTSPPYATALPYLDTDRLSLCYLKLLPRKVHRATDYQMIGNREITETQRLGLWKQYERSKAHLPQEVCHLIEEIKNMYEGADVGFRRKNLASVLAKYFLDMRQVIKGISDSVKPGGHIFIIVGDNHTVPNGTRFKIETARMLTQMAMSLGFALEEIIPMDMLKPRDIFKKNSVASEHIIHLRA